MKQLFIDGFGGATIDSAEIKSIKLAAKVGELDRDLKKGDDVELRIVCRVTGGGSDDKYDAHGNVAETVKGFKLRADELEVVSVNQQAFKTTAQAEEEKAAAAAEPEPVGTDPEPEAPVDVTALEVPQLLAVIENDTDAYADAGRVVVPEALAELQGRAKSGDGEAVEAIEKIEATNSAKEKAPLAAV